MLAATTLRSPAATFGARRGWGFPLERITLGIDFAATLEFVFHVHVFFVCGLGSFPRAGNTISEQFAYVNPFCENK